jgi:hypothetical protein
MDWQAAGDRQGSTPGRDAAARPDSPAAFGHGGTWEAALPSAALAVALETAAGPGGVYEGADADALVGMARQWAAIESWAAAGQFAALRAMMRDDDTGTPVLQRHAGPAPGWDDSLTYEIAAALAMGPASAGNLAVLAHALGTRLPGIGRLLADGILTRAKARLVAQVFEPLTEEEAARAEALVLGELAGKTYPQAERLAWRAALAVAPDVAERRRKNAERTARVTVFREEAGTAGLSGRDLPAAEALAGHANVVARARAYELSGAFPDWGTSRLQAQAYLDLLGGIPAADRIAFAAAAPPEPPEPSGPPEPQPPQPPEAPQPPGPPASPDEPGDPGPGGGGRGGAGPSGAGNGGPEPGGAGCDWDEPEAPHAPVLPAAEVTVPLATLQWRAERAGDSRLLGPLDPALARQLAAAAARSPHSRWEISVVDESGFATGHGIARDARGQPGRAQPPGTRRETALDSVPVPGTLPARVNITVTETFLRHLAAQGARPRFPVAGGGPRSGAPPGDWELIPGNPGTWTLILPGERELAVRLDVVPTHDCDHRYQTSSYQPGDKLRRLVQVRDHTCTFPTCSRPARESDFEHALPFDKGGKTDACNAGARSRRCHRVKQSPGWTVTQPRPGWHQWTTPTGRAYTQEPWRYTALPVRGASSQLLPSAMSTFAPFGVAVRVPPASAAA